MNLHDIGHVSETAGKAFTVTLTLNVEDAHALWSAAADKALQAGMTLSDVLDTIGPREDPSIADCLAMLTAPSAIAGCMLDDFDVSAAASAEPVQLPRGAGRPVLMSVAG
jgi:hypothetical protein